MSTPETPESPQLTRRQLRELRNTASNPIITPEEAEAAAAAPAVTTSLDDTAAYRRRHSPGVTPYSFLNAFENEACDWNPQRPAITSRLVCRSTRSRRAAIAIRSCESQACGVR